jgi:DtxR family Mn-dependent transcriptional regulator
VLSDDVEEAISKMLGNPTTCPHGNPIPGSDYATTNLVPLASLNIGDEFTVTRIPEELEFEPGMLEFLERSSVTPGSRGAVREVTSDGGLQVAINDKTVGLDQFACSKILVAH